MTLKEIERKFPFGSIVYFDKETIKKGKELETASEFIKRPSGYGELKGIVVGTRQQVVGHWEYPVYNPLQNEGPYFVPELSKWFLEVKIGYSNRIRLVDVQDVRPKEYTISFTTLLHKFEEIPRRFVAPMSQKDKQELSKVMKEEMKDWPRDEKGRWIKK